MPQQEFSFPLPWNQGDAYWLCLLLPDEHMDAMDAPLKSQGFEVKDGLWIKRTPRAWDMEWKQVRPLIKTNGLADSAQISVLEVTGDMPNPEEIRFHRKHADVIDTIADNLWLGEALMQTRVKCHLQPIVGPRGKAMGYEAFARMPLDGGETISGGKIIAAAKMLGIEYTLDRYLQVQAIHTFVSGKGAGYLFINFMPGFIHRPERYLEGLTETVESYGLSHKSIVLDFTQAETARDLKHLKSVFEYCRTKGYSTSMDDIESLESAQRLFKEITPDFIKLDMALTRRATENAGATTIKELVDLAHGRGSTVIAEGVETKEVFQKLLEAGVDLFQGYFFSAPVAEPQAYQEKQA